MISAIGVILCKITKKCWQTARQNKNSCIFASWSAQLQGTDFAG
ncbi:hypothetical protein HMPREF9419_2005 [Prevotella nigrescens ATCC 33563]|nr:hypothetical protein HMPREF9419_2005 [Prevotella nigrescens ATCC 33563]